jgi:niacin transporter
LNTKSTFNLTATALLIGVGIAIPIFMPKIYLEPMSFTLASHVAIFIAMMISPGMAIAVVCGTTVGFFLSGLPLVITLRAASHIVFAVTGSFIIWRKPQIINSARDAHLLSIGVGVIHAVAEMAVVSFYYFGGSYTGHSFFTIVALLVGVGTLVHSMIDYELAWLIYQGLNRQPRLKPMLSHQQK